MRRCRGIKKYISVLSRYFYKLYRCPAGLFISEAVYNPAGLTGLLSASIGTGPDRQMIPIGKSAENDG